jgi:hypothetical protein
MQAVYEPSTYNTFGGVMGDLSNPAAVAFMLILAAVFIVAVISAFEAYDRMVYRSSQYPSLISVTAFTTLCVLSAFSGVGFFMAGVRYIPQLVLLV